VQATARKAAIAAAARAAQQRTREQAEARARTLALEKLKLIAARQPASKPKDKLPSVDDCPGGPVEGSLLCEETNVQYEGGGSSNAGNTNDWANEETCVSPGLTLTPCGTFNMASDGEGDGSGQGDGGGSSGGSPGASGSGASDLANLAKDLLEKDVTLYRGMRGTDDGSPQLGQTASTLGARPNEDIYIDENGMVDPGTGGMSVNESPTGMPAFRRPPSFGGTGKNLNMYSINLSDIGPNLTYRPDPESAGHGFIEPATTMPFNDYQEYIDQTQTSWQGVLP
jgi:hypothetical protein